MTHMKQGRGTTGSGAALCARQDGAFRARPGSRHSLGFKRTRAPACPEQRKPPLPRSRTPTAPHRRERLEVADPRTAAHPRTRQVSQEAPLSGTDESEVRNTADSLAEVIFHSLHQDSLEFGSNEAVMVSRVFFDVLIRGKLIQDLFANVKQAVGASARSDPLEVTSPRGQRGFFHYRELTRCIEQYFRRIAGACEDAYCGDGAHRERRRDMVIVIRSWCSFSTGEDVADP
jgi:hypothetical protein